MTRTKAMALAREERLTWADLKAMLAKADPNARAVLSRSVGRMRILEILTAAAAEQADAEIPKACDFPLVCNILREALP